MVGLRIRLLYLIGPMGAGDGRVGIKLGVVFIVYNSKEGFYIMTFVCLSFAGIQYKGSEVFTSQEKVTAPDKFVDEHYSKKILIVQRLLEAVAV